MYRIMLHYSEYKSSSIVVGLIERIKMRRTFAAVKLLGGIICQ